MPTDEQQHARKARIMAALEEHPFEAPAWLRTKHRQSSWNAMHRRVQPITERHERWATPDRDFLDLYYSAGGTGMPWVLLLHGLEDHANTPYVLGMRHAITAAGWNCVVMEFRSCGTELNRARRLYHMGETSDLAFVMRWLRPRLGPAPLFLLGFSLGANVAAKWLGEQGAAAADAVQGAALVSAPFDPTIGAANIHKQLGGLYMKAFLGSLVPKALAKEMQFPGTLDVAAVSAAKHFWDFDTHVTARLHGFQDADDYWRKVGCHQFIGGIRVPSLLLSAADDPFNPPESLPVETAQASPWLYPVFPETGGHLGFIQGASPDAPRYWAEEQILRFFRCCAEDIA